MLHIKKMNSLKQKLLNKTLVSVTAIIFLVGGMSVLILKRDNAPLATITPDLSFSTTPTPYPLPTTAYDLPSRFTIIAGQIFGKRNQSIDPIQIEEAGQQQAETEHLELRSAEDYLPVDIQWWQKASEEVYEYVSQRLDTIIHGKVIVTFLPPQSGECPTRGIAFREQQPMIGVFADEETSKDQILAVLAHELGHLFIYQKYENLNDPALAEGMATWAAGDYWKEWQGFDFNSGVRIFLNNGTYLPLSQNYDLKIAHDNHASDCIARRDVLYTEFASFLDYLIQSRGMEPLSTLFDVRQPQIINNQRVVYPPNFKDVYGLELNQLEYEWLQSLLQPGQ